MFSNKPISHALPPGMSPFAGAVLVLAMTVLVGMPLAATTFHDFKMQDIDGQVIDFQDFRGKVVLVVNTASYCGFTGQFDGLEKLYTKYKNSGLVIVGFPTNDFLGQDPGSDAEIKAFCTAKYQVSFPMFSKIVVKGKGQSPLYSWLTNKATNPKTAGEISWNFNKFLIGKDGKVMARFDSAVGPEADTIIKAIEAQLKA